MADKPFLYKELSYKLQGIFFDIRNTYGPGQKEMVYANLLSERLNREGISFEREKRLSIYSQETGKIVGIYQPDFVIDNKIIIEIKAHRIATAQDEQQLYYYLRNSNYELGYLVNFGTSKLLVKRILYTNNRKPFLQKAAVALLCVFVFSFVWIRGADAAQLLLYPDPLEIPEGETGLLEVRLDTEDQDVNAAEIVLHFPPGALVVRDVLVGGSVLPLAPEAPFIGIDTVKITGGAPSGFNGSGLVARLLLSIKEGASSDSATVSFDENTRVFLNDGKATPALTTTRPAQVVRIAPSALELVS